MVEERKFRSVVYEVVESTRSRFGFCRVMEEGNLFTILYRSPDLRDSKDQAQVQADSECSFADFLADLEDRYGVTVGSRRSF